ncbi:NAD-dependent epimerase/dehydratase family protein [Streptomyces sp. NPDC050416]|uniref:NAD-dependent epimerase/dehydratase family protein n=1 Tax=Streptomyces sp. NPDC050416 TaxID=3365611 RepID=UPI0037BC9532
MKTLVTGGAGFIGGWIRKELNARGHQVLVFDHQDRRQQLAAGEEFFLGDVRDATAVTEAAAHVDGIIHLAAVLGTQETISNPRPSAETNILGSLNVFEAATQYRLPTVYAGVGNHAMRLQGTGCYTITKSAAEDLARMYNLYRDGGRITIVRPVNAYGPGQSIATPYGCVDPRTPVLCSDLAWRPISSLREGDEIIGIDEYAPARKQRKLRRATVTGSWATRKHAVRLHFDDGRSVTCSLDHPWLASSPSGQIRQWMEARKLRTGDRVVWVTDQTWGTGDSRSHGYIAGLLDGEGHVGGHGPVFTQNPGPVLDEYLHLLKEFEFAPQTRTKENGRIVVDAWVSGLSSRLRLLGEFRPVRLLAKASQLWEDRAPNGGRATIVAIEELGETDLWDIETTSHTYIANGFASHNSSKVRKIAPSFVCRALTGTDIEVYGDGTQISDCVYVADVARAFVAALEHTAEHGPTERPVEVGPLESCTVNDIARLVAEEATGYTGLQPVGIKHLPMRPGEVPNAVVTSDTSTLQQIGMTADDFVPLDEGIHHTVRYYAEHWLPGYLAA